MSVREFQVISTDYLLVLRQPEVLKAEHPRVVEEEEEGEGLPYPAEAAEGVEEAAACCVLCIVCDSSKTWDMRSFAFKVVY